MARQFFAKTIGGYVKKFCFAPLVALFLCLFAAQAEAVTCTPTGFFRDGINMTAARINPVGTVTGNVDGTGCNIVIYYDHLGNGGTVNANVFGANYFGVLINGDNGAVNVDFGELASVHAIGETPHNGTQHGVGIYYRGFFLASNVTGKIKGSKVYDYQKGGIVANGQGVQLTISDTTITGDGRVNFIAQNGIQIGYGALVSSMRNKVSNNSYDGHGDGSASAGILVVGGPGYGICPDGNDCPFTGNSKINDSTLTNNDVGIYLSNYEADFSAPADSTNIKAVNNTITNDLCFNSSYQAGVSDVGNNDKIVNATISGIGYTNCSTVFNPSSNKVDADTSFTNRPKVHAIK